jgi:hypothetical protein
MSQIAPACATLESAPAFHRDRWGLVRWVGTKNPFYALSALLVLVGLWRSFGAQASPEQTWALMFGLAGYTLLLAWPACLLVRFGGVWDDVRTVLLLVVLMFLATSVTFDVSLVRNPALGLACSGLGLGLAVLLSEAMLRTLRLHLPAAFRWPYYLFLTLFFVYPAALVSLLDRPRGEALEWALFGFSATAGLVALTLLPAIRRGREYVRDNGSPWRWPMYPWALYVFLGFGVVARSFLLCWSMQPIERTDPERLIFGAYFLVPFLFAVAVLLLEIGLVARRSGPMLVALLMPAGLVYLAIAGDGADELYWGFLRHFRERLGATPLYLTVAASGGFYVYAALRGIARAIDLLALAVGALVVIGPNTLDLHRLGPARAWPLLVIAVLELGLGLRRRSAPRCLMGLVGLTLAACLTPGESVPHRAPAVFHAVLAAWLLLGAAFRDAYGRFLRASGAIVVLGACLAVTGGWVNAAGIPAWTLGAYPPLMGAALGTYGLVVGDRTARRAAGAALVGWGLALGGREYRVLRKSVAGLDYLAAGLLLLVVAHVIGVAKAGLLKGFKVKDTNAASTAS